MDNGFNLSGRIIILNILIQMYCTNNNCIVYLSVESALKISIINSIESIIVIFNTRSTIKYHQDHFISLSSSIIQKFHSRLSRDRTKDNITWIMLNKCLPQRRNNCITEANWRAFLILTYLSQFRCFASPALVKVPKKIITLN